MKMDRSNIRRIARAGVCTLIITVACGAARAQDVAADAQPAEPPDQKWFWVRVTGDRVNVRNRPDINSLIATRVTRDTVLRAERTGRRVREIGVEFRKRKAGRAHFGRPHDILWTLKDMLRLRFHTWRKGWGR